MKTNILLLLINERKQQAPTVQKVLTEWGCLIKTRLGLHSGILDDCTNTGLIFLELVGEKDKHDEMARKLNLLEGVSAKLVELELKD
ncbi:MAG: hypothetical protein HN833_04395 [Elusimicrobiaceae bacterium]|jgi:hypothetical protein|nr:hypothetical protein [Elusimicrobiaceae bacterium]MBT3954979.1 hypothetical protein [Elusimicrobiaceae bacterium]MBT4008129.1 hypothetical protein [Elusimicrobiaceae bacterium]MBT4402675.1 hypothetical protein [Elusimicrobiaceae bacterium]MBT4440041.1 hypothetical protein [Elusimicrobiaceae bacterium]